MRLSAAADSGLSAAGLREPGIGNGLRGLAQRLGELGARGERPPGGSSSPEAPQGSTGCGGGSFGRSFLPGRFVMRRAFP